MHTQTSADDEEMKMLKMKNAELRKDFAAAKRKELEYREKYYILRDENVKLRKLNVDLQTVVIDKIKERDGTKSLLFAENITEILLFTNYFDSS